MSFLFLYMYIYIYSYSFGYFLQTRLKIIMRPEYVQVIPVSLKLRHQSAFEALFLFFSIFSTRAFICLFMNILNIVFSGTRLLLWAQQSYPPAVQIFCSRGAANQKEAGLKGKGGKKSQGATPRPTMRWTRITLNCESFSVSYSFTFKKYIG